MAGEEAIGEEKLVAFLFSRVAPSSVVYSFAPLKAHESERRSEVSLDFDGIRRYFICRIDLKVDDPTKNVIREVDGNLRMVKRMVILPFLSVLIVWACAPARDKKTSLEIPFQKIDHFVVGECEVGALEYEPYMLPSGYVQLYYFPVYKAGERAREFYVNL